MKTPIPVTIDDLEASALDDKDGYAIYEQCYIEVFAYAEKGPQAVTYQYLKSGKRISRDKAIEIILNA